MRVRYATRLWVAVVWAAAAAAAYAHSADSDDDGRLRLAELLRVIQLFNAGELHCDGGTEDGYAPGPGPQTCPHHDSDYAPADWRIAFSELLRGIQFYNSPAIEACPGEATEDGYCLTVPPPVEGAPEGGGEGAGEGATEGAAEGGGEGHAEGTPEGAGEGTAEGGSEGTVDGAAEGGVEGTGEGVAEGTGDGAVEGSAEGTSEGAADGASEGTTEGTVEGANEGGVEGAGEGEGAPPCDLETPPYPIGHIGPDFVDASRGNRTVPVEIYYPGVFTGDNAPVAGPSCRTFPVVIFGHGYQTGINKYGYLWQNLAPQGYIVVLVDTANELTWNFSDFGADLAFAAAAVQAEGASPASVLFGRVASATAIMGHSMGGGAAMFAATFTGLETTVIGLAPSAVEGGVITAAGQANTSTLVLGASKDCIVAPGSHAIPIYQAIPAPCKHYVEIRDGSHCQFAQDGSTCELGETILCFGEDFIEENYQRAITMALVQPWLDYHLKSRAGAYDTFLANLQAQSTAGAISNAAGSCP